MMSAIKSGQYNTSHSGIYIFEGIENGKKTTILGSIICCNNDYFYYNMNDILTSDLKY